MKDPDLPEPAVDSCRFIIRAAPILLIGSSIALLILGPVDPARASSKGSVCATGWVRQPSANPATGGDVLNGVSIGSAQDAWAVGDQASHNIEGTLTEHWNGRSWSAVTSPSPGTDYSILTGVSELSPTDVWRRGRRRRPPARRP
jgi:hypothetical protein